MLGQNRSERLDATPKTPPPAATAERPSVLLACRDTSARRWGARWLQNAGFETAVTREAEEAIILFEQRLPRVVIVEAGMRRGGRTVCEALRSRPEGRDLPILVLCGSRKSLRLALEQGATDVVQKPFDWEVVSRRAGHLLRMQGAVAELDEVHSKLEEARSLVEATRERMSRMVSTDSLTGLPTRTAFQSMLSHALNSAYGSAGVAVLVADVDRFKALNEVLGWRGGNEILAQVAKRLTETLRGAGLLSRNRPGPSASALARLSGDEFTLMVTNVRSLEEARELGRRVTESLRNRVEVGGREVQLSASVGVAFYPEHGESGEEILRHAELAMCEAKRKGGDLAYVYSEALSEATEKNIELGQLLHEAFERRELELHYQPLVTLEGRVIGAEALLRWEHRELGSIAPARFVPVAEESGLMRSIGTWVLRTACRRLRSWIDDGLPRIRMSVNVSLCQFAHGDLPSVVREALEEFQLEASWLELELSERGVLRSDPDILRQLAELKEIGVRLSVDDFGTGDSAVAYLKKFPLDTLKIDRSYVHGVEDDEDDAAITSATIAMAHQLRLQVIAEGVESQAQLEFLRGHACDEYQGFLFSPAVPADEFRKLLESRPRAGSGSER